MKSNKLIMRHPVIFFFVLVLLFPVLAFAEADKIFKENSKAVVVVVAYNEKGEPISQGSGFIIRPDGAVVTNYHVISNAESIKIKAGNEVLDIEGIIHIDKENDLVILKAKGGNLPIVRLGDIEKVNIGEKVYVISSPQGLENTISEGILSGIREITEERKLLQITASISSGSSGSPVFNQYGKVIGIATFLLEESQNLNFAMPINLIVDKINNTKITKLKDSHIENYAKAAEYYYNLALAYVESSKYQKAIDAYKQAIRINPDDAKAHYFLGLAYVESSKYQEAIDAFRQAIRINPDDAKAHYNLGLAYVESSKYQEAIDAFKLAIKINPDDSELHSALGRTYYLFGFLYGKSDKYQEAIDELKLAISLKPDDEDAHFALGYIYIEKNDKGSALDEYKILKKLNKERANELFNKIYP